MPSPQRAAVQVFKQASVSTVAVVALLVAFPDDLVAAAGALRQRLVQASSSISLPSSQISSPLDDPVTAARLPRSGCCSRRVVVVAVVAVFTARPEVSVAAAGRRQPAVQASVSDSLPSSHSSSPPQNAVAAARHHAARGAAVRVDLVAVIAGLTLVDPAVAAALEAAVRGAAVALDVVAVVALFKACLTGLDVAPQDPVAAARHGSRVQASRSSALPSSQSSTPV